MIELFIAGPQDVHTIAAIGARCFPDPWPEDMIRRQLSRFTVAAVDGIIAGFIALSFVLDEGSIDDIAVDPEHRRKGVADALVRYAVEKGRSQGAATMLLEVRAGNQAALALYRKHGFREVGRRRDYYERPREDAILMTLVI